MRIHERAGHPTGEVYELSVGGGVMRRRIAILLATLSALTVMGFGLAMGAAAQADIFDDGPQRDGPVPFDPAGRRRPATSRSTSAPSSQESGRWASTTSTSTWSATRRSIRSSPRRWSTSRGPTARSSSSRSSGCGSVPRRPRGPDRPRPGPALSNRAEPLRHRARLLRAALLALQGEPAGCLRGLEPDGVLPRHRRQRRLTVTPVAPGQTGSGPRGAGPSLLVPGYHPP